MRQYSSGFFSAEIDSKYVQRAEEKRAVLPVFRYCLLLQTRMYLVAKLVVSQIKEHRLLSAEGKRRQRQSSCRRVKIWTLRSKPKRDLPEWGLQDWGPWGNVRWWILCLTLSCRTRPTLVQQLYFDLWWVYTTSRLFPKSACDFEHLSLFWLCFQN